MAEITYREALLLKDLPKSLLIVGAGAIGVEFAYYFNSFDVEVHLVEMLPQLLPQEAHGPDAIHDVYTDVTVPRPWSRDATLLDSRPTLEER